MDSAIQSISTGSMLHLALLFQIRKLGPRMISKLPKAAQFIRDSGQEGDPDRLLPTSDLPATFPAMLYSQSLDLYHLSLAESLFFHYKNGTILTDSLIEPNDIST